MLLLWVMAWSAQPQHARLVRVRTVSEKSAHVTSLSATTAAKCPQLSVALVGAGTVTTKEKVESMTSPDIRVFAITAASAEALNGMFRPQYAQCLLL